MAPWFGLGTAIYGVPKSWREKHRTASTEPMRKNLAAKLVTGSGRHCPGHLPPPQGLQPGGLHRGSC